MNYQKINETIHHEWFQRFPFNRETIPNHINRLKKSIETHGFLLPILVTKYEDSLYILDGQNRVEAAKLLDPPVPIKYIILEYETPLTLEAIAILVSTINENSVRWKVMDYMNAWVKLGKKQYLNFQTFYIKQEIYFIEAFMLMVRYDGSKYPGPYNRGTITFNDGDYNKAEKKITIFKKVLNCTERFGEGGLDIRNDGKFRRAVFWILNLKKCNPDHLIEKIIRNPALVAKSTTVGGYKEMLVSLYNTGKTERLRLYLDSESEY